MSDAIRGSIFRFLCVSVGIVGLGACATSKPRAHAPADAVPTSVSVDAAEVTLGVAIGTIRAPAEVGKFNISTAPTTVAQYRRCVDAGVCSKPSETAGTCDPGAGPGAYAATYDVALGTQDIPVTCVSARQSVEYCEWVGGRLPRLSEWMLAARGSSVRRFPWGADAPSCTRVARTSFGTDDPAACCGSDCSDSHVATVLQHAGGASPAGVQDILLTRSEIVGAEDQSPFAPCKSPALACLVSGLSPGAIDSVLPIQSLQMLTAISPTLPAAGFRCAWDGGSQ